MRNQRGSRAVMDLVCLALVAGMMIRGVLAQSSSIYDLGVDVPSTLGGVDFTPENIILRNGMSYSLDLALPAGTAIAALDRLPDGRWLFSTDYPVTLQGIDYEPRDVVSYNGSTFALYLHGSAISIPSTARIDALFVDSLGNSILSFDSWVTIGGSNYGPSDLVMYSGAFSLYLSGSAVGVPGYSNMVGAGIDSSGELIVTFDVPTNLGGTEYQPGQLVGWTGSSFTNYSVDPLWPASAQLRDFSFTPPGCQNTACNDGCWADGVHSSSGTKAVKTVPQPPECEPGTGGCVTSPC